MAIHLYGRPGRTKDALKKVGYRLYRPELGSPDSQGFYHGYPCHLGHTLRDKKSHWCHDCAFRINSHVVGLDISFLDDLYSDRAVAVINMLKELRLFINCSGEISGSCTSLVISMFARIQTVLTLCISHQRSTRTTAGTHHHLIISI